MQPKQIEICAFDNTISTRINRLGVTCDIFEFRGTIQKVVVGVLHLAEMQNCGEVIVSESARLLLQEVHQVYTQKHSSSPVKTLGCDRIANSTGNL